MLTRRSPLADRLWNVGKWMVGPWWWVTALAALSPFWFAPAARSSRASRDAFLLLALLLLVSLVSLVWQGQGLMYHASGVYVCLVLMALINVAACVRLMLAGPMVLRVGACLLLIGFLFGTASRLRTYYLPPLAVPDGTDQCRKLLFPIHGGRVDDVGGALVRRHDSSCRHRGERPRQDHPRLEPGNVINNSRATAMRRDSILRPCSCWQSRRFRRPPAGDACSSTKWSGTNRSPASSRMIGCKIRTTSRSNSCADWCTTTTGRSAQPKKSCSICGATPWRANKFSGEHLWSHVVSARPQAAACLTRAAGLWTLDAPPVMLHP